MKAGDAALKDNIKALRDKYIKNIQRFVLMDDTFMRKVFEDKECAELLLRIILNRDDLTVEKAETQHCLNNLQGRSVQLDIYAVDKNKRHYNIEVQRDDNGAIPERARYNSSLMDANLTQKGSKYTDLPETYVIFITENDVLKGGKPLYTIDRTIKELDHISFGDRSHIIYVNGECRDSTALGKLMQDFFCSDPQKMNYSVLANRVKYFKEDKEGVNDMCRIMEELREETSRKEKIKFANNLISEGSFSFEKISKLAGLPVKEVEKLASGMVKKSKS